MPLTFTIYFPADVIGVVTRVQTIEQTNIIDRQTSRRTIMIQNIR